MSDETDFDDLISGLNEENEPEVERPSTATFQNPIHGSYKLVGAFLPNQYVNERHTGVDADGNKTVGGHWGEDYSTSAGTPVYATAPGKVISTAPNPKGGNAVKIQHPGNITSYYAHLNSISTNVNDNVDQNTVIGTVGNSGNAKETAPHLHFEIKISGSPVAPSSMFGKEVKQAEMEQLLNKISHLAKAARTLNDFGVDGTEILKQANYDFKKAAQLAKSKC